MYDADGNLRDWRDEEAWERHVGDILLHNGTENLRWYIDEGHVNPRHDRFYCNGFGQRLPILCCAIVSGGGDVSMLKLLVESGSPVTGEEALVSCYDGAVFHTPMSLALQHCNVDAIHFLLEHGVDPLDICLKNTRMVVSMNAIDYALTLPEIHLSFGSDSSLFAVISSRVYPSSLLDSYLKNLFEISLDIEYESKKYCMALLEFGRSISIAHEGARCMMWIGHAAVKGWWRDIAKLVAEPMLWDIRCSIAAAVQEEEKKKKKKDEEKQEQPSLSKKIKKLKV